MTFRFEDVIAWKKAYQFTLLSYQITTCFPDSERFGLCSQFRRAAVSIAANISEGYKKLSKQDKLRFMNIAQGSLEECRCYIYLSRDLGYINQETFDRLYSSLEETSKFLNLYCQGIIKNKHSNDE